MSNKVFTCIVGENLLFLVPDKSNETLSFSLADNMDIFLAAQDRKFTPLLYCDFTLAKVYNEIIDHYKGQETTEYVNWSKVKLVPIKWQEPT